MGKLYMIISLTTIGFVVVDETIGLSGLAGLLPNRFRRLKGKWDTGIGPYWSNEKVIEVVENSITSAEFEESTE